MKKVIFTLTSMLLISSSAWSAVGTEIQPSDCGTTLTSMTQNIFATAVPGANRYEFRVDDGANTYTRQRNSTAFRPSLIKDMLYGTPYTIDVQYSTDAGATWSGYGASCTVTTLAAGALTTKADDTQGTFDCGGTIASFSTNVFAEKISNAANYEFRYTGTAGSANGSVVSKVREVSYVRGNLVPGLIYNSTYDLDVRWQQADGTWSAYGATCTIIAPTTSPIVDANCGTTLASMSTNVFSSQVAGAPHYKFRLIQDVVGIPDDTIDVVRPNNWIRPDLVPGILFNTDYFITTAIETAPGVYGDFDNVSCKVTTPGSAQLTTTELTTADCAVGTLTSMGQNLFADAVNGAARYIFKWTEISTSTDFYSSRTGNSTRPTLVKGTNYDETYVVSVRYINSLGDTSVAGATCTINTPTATGLMSGVTGADCGSSFTNSQTIHADAVASAANYKFTFYGTTDTLSRIMTSPKLRPSQVAGMSDDTYKVTVAWKQANGTWSSEDAGCNVTVNNAPSLAIVLNKDDKTANGESNNDATTKSNMVESFNVSAFPNPSAANTILSANAAIENVEIYTVAGQLVYSNQPNTNQVNIDLNSFENGIYIVKSFSNESVNVLRLVKR